MLTGQSANGLNKDWDTDKMVEEMQANLEITQAFITETGNFLEQRAKAADADRKEAQEKLDDPNLNLSPQERAGLEAIAQGTTIWDTGGTERLLLTALTGALSGNVSGSGADLLQNAAINTIQGLGATQIKDLVDNHLAGDDTARAALQGILACSGAAAQGADCGSAVLGASTAVVIGALMKDKIFDPALGRERELTAQEKIDRINLLNTLIGGITHLAGGDEAVATAAAQIEMENNQLYSPGNRYKPGDVTECTISRTGYCIVSAQHPDGSEPIVGEYPPDWYVNIAIDTDEDYQQLVAQGKAPARGGENFVGDMAVLGNAKFNDGCMANPLCSSTIAITGAHPITGKLSEEESKDWMVAAVIGVGTVVIGGYTFRLTSATTKLPSGYRSNAAGNVIGPQGGQYVSTGRVDASGKTIYQQGSHYYTFDATAGKVASNTPYLTAGTGGRPTWQQSEADVGAGLGPGARSQVNYYNGVEVSGNVKGSIRVDWQTAGPQGNLAIEVKNYHIGNNSHRLIGDIVDQAQTRATHLPSHMRQEYHIDIRGQNVTFSQQAIIERQIINKSNGIIKAGDIIWIEK